ncbi:MAG: hypothetical protein EXS13_13670 [Planctomycetes bacterium]|nr:hypothetical protein [Planctomycetota bacterium]
MNDRPERCRARQFAPTAAWLMAVLVGAAATTARSQENGGEVVTEPPVTSPPAAASATPLAPALSSWHDFAALRSELDALVDGRREVARLVIYGKSRAGRELWCIELGMIDHPQRERLPALLVVAGLDGQHLVGTAVVLDHAKRLLDGYGTDAAITKLLDEHLVYLVPRANPDGAEAAFAEVKRELRGNLRPIDDDRDGQVDEDAPEDLNGDGVITQMRWHDPAGTLIADPENPRLLRPADALKGERGYWKTGVEGIDRDGDGEYGEDGPGDGVPNRNFPQRWQEFDAAAGRVPMDEPESLALGQFLLDHPAIAITLVYGVHDNVAVDAKGDSGGEAPAAGGGASAGGVGGGFGGFRMNRSMPAGIVRDDQGLYGEVATRYRKTTGVTSKALLEADDGAFVPFSYFQFGIPTFAAHLWSPPLDVKAPEAAKEPSNEGAAAGNGGVAPPEKKVEATPEAKPEGEAEVAAPAVGAREGGGGGRRGRGGGGPDGGGPGGGGGSGAGGAAKVDADDAKLLLWNDHAMGGSAFVPWTPARHPTLGEVEVGGWRPYARANPPLDQVAELAKKHSDFLIELGALFAQLRLGELKVENLGGDLFRVTAAVVNDGWMPSLSSMAERNRRPKSARLDLDLGSAKLLQGQVRHTWSRIEGSGGRREVKWLLQAEPGTEVLLRLWSEKAGDDERAVELQ